MKKMQDIAEELGVSIATVSYVYNNRWQEKRISKQLVEKIKKKLEEEEYQPNFLSLQLITQRTQSIGIILGDLSRIFNLSILCGIEKVLSNMDYLCLVISSHLGKKEKEYLKMLSLRKVEGAIFSPQSNGIEMLPFLKKFCEKVPTVFVDNYIPEINTSFVVSDNYYGAYQATRYLIKKGYKKIAYLGSKKNLSALNDRKRGYIDALRDSRIGIWEIQKDGINISTLQECFSKDRPDAIFVESFLYFKEGFNFFYKKGIKIPDDIGLTGFDPVDLSLSEMSDVNFHLVVREPIPFVEQKGEEIGKIAAEILLEQIEGKDKIKQIFIKPELKNFE